MDAAQIMMMPTAAGSTQVSVLPAATTNNALAGLFVNMLGQNILGLDGLCGLQQNTLQSQPEPVLAPSTDSMVALTHERADQDLPSTESDPAFVNQLAAYAQLAILQASLPVQQPQQTAATTTEETTALPVLEGVTAAQPGLQIASTDVPGTLSMFAAEIPDNETAAQNVADSKKESTGPQNEVQQAMISRTEAVVTPKAVTIPQPMAANSKPQMAAATDASSIPVQQQAASLNAESDKQVQKSQVSGQQATQQAVDTQPVAQEVPGAVKVTSTAVQQPVRFAQHPDVVAAAAGSEGQKNASSDQQNQGSQLMAKASKELVLPGEQLKPELAENKGTVFSLPEQHAVPMHMGQPLVVAATDGPAAETGRAVPQEMISRQVTDRLVGHEIKQGNDQISLKLSPENLGNLQLNMRMDDNRLKLEIVAENRGVRDALLQQADELKENLAKQNIRVDSFEVTTSNNGNLSQQSRDWRQAASEQRQNQQQYAVRATNVSGSFETPVHYFAKQYQSTIDVRF